MLDTNTISRKRRKKTIRTVSVIFLSIILLLTFSSKTILQILLPEVEVTQGKAGELIALSNWKGTVYARQTEKLFAYGNEKVKEVNVSAGQVVKKGDTLAVLDIRSSNIEIKKAELSLLRAEHERLRSKEEYEAVIKEYRNGRTRTGSGDAAWEMKAKEYDRLLEEKDAELEIIQLELADKKHKVPAGGLLKAPVDGQIISVSTQQGSFTSPGQVLFELISDEQNLSIKWMVDPQQGGDIKPNDSLQMSILLPEKISFDGVIANKTYLAAEGKYEVTSDIREDVPGLEMNQRVDITLRRTSQKYPLIVARSCVVRENAKDYIYLLKTRSGVWGEENFVQKKEVKVVETDEWSAAISGLGLSAEDKIVSFSSKVLADQTQVKLR